MANNIEMSTDYRAKQITKTSLIGVGVNLILAGFKAVVGLLSGSIAIVLDAVNNTTDAVSSIITIVGIKLAKRKPDKDHPYGHGRIEYFSAIIISGIILAAGLMSLIESVEKIIEPEMPDYTVPTLITVGAAIVVKFFLGRFVKSQGKKYNSDALIASGSDAGFDAIISAATLAGGLITVFFKVNIDGIIGAVISVFIVKAGIEMLLESISSVMGSRPDSQLTKDIKASVASVDGVIGAYDLILHSYGPNTAIASIHVEIPSSMTAGQIHRLTKTIQEKVYNEFAIFITVGIYSVDESRAKDIQAIKDIVIAYEGTLGTHGIYFDDDKKLLSFDVAVDFTVSNRAALKESIENEVKKLYPGYVIIINFDEYYSD